MNNQKEIERLLSQFYEGITTPEEEIDLYRLLIDQPEGTNYTSEQLAFIAMMETSNEVNSDSWSEEDKQFANWLDGKLTKKEAIEVPFFRHFQRWRGYAAAIVVILAVGALTLLFQDQAPEPLALRNGQVISQEEASQEVQKSLQLLANCFEYTGQATQKTSETFSELHRVLEKSTKKVKQKNK